MSLLIIAFLSVFCFSDVHISADHSTVVPYDQRAAETQMVDIDSNDQVVFDFDQVTFDGDIIEVPVYITSDDMIFSLDFSMLINIESLTYESIVDHTGSLDYTAFVNPNDFKLRFTSNSFSPYPTYPQKAVSVRFKVLHGIVHLSDFSMIVAYLNGVNGCSFGLQLQGEEIVLANKEIITNETFITPNPAEDVLYIGSDQQGTLDVFDVQGTAVIKGHRIESDGTNRINVQFLPRGIYTVRLTTEDHTVKTQRIILQ